MKRLTILSVLFLMLSCSKEPSPINYGTDDCHFCQMTIVDRVHAAEIVTKKAKIYKFDAIECMVNFLGNYDNSKVELFLANNYLVPESLIDATQATFLISKNISSPMGAFLSSFQNAKDAEKVQITHGGKLYNWQELLSHLK